MLAETLTWPDVFASTAAAAFGAIIIIVAIWKS